jgi:CRP/FNR family transcriptional regulator, cyclic AMP receptor protein
MASANGTELKAGFLQKSELFRDLTRDQIREVAQIAAMTTCHRGRVFFRPGQRGEVLFILKAGSVALYRITEDGRKVVTGTVQAGSVFGEMSLLGQDMGDAYAEALEDCTICALSREDVIRLIARFPSIAVRMLEHLASRLQQAEERLADAAHRPVQARVAGTLLRVAGEDRVARLSHRDVAEIAGTQRETVTRILHLFRAEGLVESERLAIRILEPEQLASIAATVREL